jgi:hypothetical protein
MADKLVKYYEIAKEKGGTQAQMRLAMKTAMSSDKAKLAPDTAENLDKFYSAMKDIIGPAVPRL